MALIGDTIRLNVEFKTFEGVYSDPQELKMTIYDRHKNVVTPTTLLTGSSKVETGIYRVDYTIPNIKAEALVCEFTGTLEGLPIVGRSIINIEWVR